MQSAGARVLLVVAVSAAMLSYGAWIATRTALDPNATAGAARRVLATDLVQRNLRNEIAQQVDKDLGNQGGNDRVPSAVGIALHDPRVVDAFTTALHDMHAALLDDAGGRVTIDTGAVTGAVHDALESQDRSLATKFTRHAPLTITIGADNLPLLSRTRDVADAVLWLGALAALFLGAASLVLAHDRRSVARAGRRIAYLGVGPMILFVAAPRLLGDTRSGVVGVASALLRSYGTRVVGSAVASVVIGVAVVIGAYAVPRSRSATVDSPAPPPSAPPVSPVREKVYL